MKEFKRGHWEDASHGVSTKLAKWLGRRSRLKEKVNARTTDNSPWHKLMSLFIYFPTLNIESIVHVSLHSYLNSILLWIFLLLNSWHWKSPTSNPNLPLWDHETPPWGWEKVGKHGNVWTDVVLNFCNLAEIPFLAWHQLFKRFPHADAF